MAQSKIRTYGAPWCPDCRRAKQFLGEQRVTYEWIDVDKNPEGLKYVQEVNEGKQIIPTIVFQDGSILVEPSNAELAAKLGISTKKLSQNLNHKCIDRFLGRFVWFLQKHREGPHGETRDARDHLGSTGRALGTDRTYHPGGRPAQSPGPQGSDPRQMLNGIIFRLRSGCQWNRLPKELGDDSTIHRTFQRWVGTGVLHRMWGALVEGCEELDGVDWEWQAADGAMGKARFGGT